jgi:hypothetical protein
MTERYSKPVEKASMNRMGVHRSVVAVYGVLSLAAVGRSTFQIITKFDEAPLAYTLSGVAALVYVVATIAVALSSRPKTRILALAAITFELMGVLAIGTLSLVQPDLFPDATVWSHFGMGYLFIPLVLPVVGLWWLIRGRQQ